MAQSTPKPNFGIVSNQSNHLAQPLNLTFLTFSPAVKQNQAQSLCAKWAQSEICLSMNASNQQISQSFSPILAKPQLKFQTFSPIRGSTSQKHNFPKLQINLKPFPKSQFDPKIFQYTISTLQFPKIIFLTPKLS